MASAARLARPMRPIQSILIRRSYSNPPQPPTVNHTSMSGADTAQTTAHVPAPTPPEHHVPIPADIVSGAPDDLRSRTVRIYRPAKNAMQSGLHGNLYWRLDWDIKPKDNRWEHPVMHWASRFIRLCQMR